MFINTCDWTDRIVFNISFLIAILSYAAVCLSFCLLFSLLLSLQVEVYILSVYIYVWDPFPVAGEFQLKDVELRTDITVWATYVIYLF